jgi:hypothetical protein
MLTPKRMKGGAIYTREGLKWRESQQNWLALEAHLGHSSSTAANTPQTSSSGLTFSLENSLAIKCQATSSRLTSDGVSCLEEAYCSLVVILQQRRSCRLTLLGSSQSALNLPCTLLEVSMQQCTTLSTCMYWEATVLTVS